MEEDLAVILDMIFGQLFYVNNKKHTEIRCESKRIVDQCEVLSEQSICVASD